MNVPARRDTTKLPILALSTRTTSATAASSYGRRQDRKRSPMAQRAVQGIPCTLRLTCQRARVHHSHLAERSQPDGLPGFGRDRQRALCPFSFVEDRLPTDSDNRHGFADI